MFQKLLQLTKKGWLASKKGFSLIEVLLAIALFSLMIGILVSAPIYGEEAILLYGSRGRAIALAEEGLEATRNLRDANYANLIPGTYGLTTTSNHWALGASPDATGIFSRAITITSLSANTRQIVSTVSWPWISGRTGSISLTTYLTNWR